MSETAQLKVKKAGIMIPISFERLLDEQRKGHYEPSGSKAVQWISWVIGLILFQLWRGLERGLRKFRHYRGVFGYEYHDAEYGPFGQKKRWVADEHSSIS